MSMFICCYPSFIYRLSYLNPFFLFLKKHFKNGLRILLHSKRSFLERSAPRLRNFIELHNDYKILILDPIKDKFNY